MASGDIDDFIQDAGSGISNTYLVILNLLKASKKR